MACILSFEKNRCVGIKVFLLCLKISRCSTQLFSTNASPLCSTLLSFFNPSLTVLRKGTSSFPFSLNHHVASSSNTLCSSWIDRCPIVWLVHLCWEDPCLEQGEPGLNELQILCRVTPARCIWTKVGWPSRQATPSSGDSQLLSRTKSKSSRGVILYIMIILWPLKGWAGGPYAYVKVWDADIINPNPVNGNKYVNNVTSVEVKSYNLKPALENVEQSFIKLFPSKVLSKCYNPVLYPCQYLELLFMVRWEANANTNQPQNNQRINI